MNNLYVKKLNSKRLLKGNDAKSGAVDEESAKKMISPPKFSPSNEEKEPLKETRNFSTQTESPPPEGSPSAHSRTWNVNMGISNPPSGVVQAMCHVGRAPAWKVNLDKLFQLAGETASRPTAKPVPERRSRPKDQSTQTEVLSSALVKKALELLAEVSNKSVQTVLSRSCGCKDAAVSVVAPQLRLPATGAAEETAVPPGAAPQAQADGVPPAARKRGNCGVRPTRQAKTTRASSALRQRRRRWF